MLLHIFAAIMALAPIPPLNAIAAVPCAPARHLEGALDFRGDRWPLRLFTEPSGDSLAVAIDIPELMMVRRPIPARCRHDSLVVNLPFGFGEVALAPQTDGAWLGSRTLGGDTLRLSFARGAPPPYTAVRRAR